MKTILAIDSFKGCLTSAEAEEAVGSTLTDMGMEYVSMPVSDGGDGMLDAFAGALHATKVTAPVTDPLMRPVQATYAVSPDGTAIIETAQACGLHLMRRDERRPLVATTYGVGLLVAHALKNGCRDFIIGLGGSGTSDAGMGMLRALTDTFAKGQTIDNVRRTAIRGCRFTLASDVRNPLCGPDGAAAVYAPQKGASAEDVQTLDRRARQFADISARHMGHDRSGQPGAGAAGGLGYAFMQFLDAEVKSGADLLLDLLGFDSAVGQAGIVITGEGSADRQTLMGKLPERVLRRAQRHGTPVWIMAGRVQDHEELLAAGFARAYCITPDGMPDAEAMNPDTARQNLRRCTAQAMEAWLRRTQKG